MKNRKFNGHPVPEKLPSLLQIGDWCDYVVTTGGNLALEPDSILIAGQVIKVHFSYTKVMYDLEFTVSLEGKTRNVTRVHNVDSALVVKREDEYINNFQRSYADRVLEGIKAMTVNATVWFSHGELPDQITIPTKVPSKPQRPAGYSADVLIDLDGTGKYFRVGWFDFDEQRWRFHDTEAAWTHDLKWTYLPI